MQRNWTTKDNQSGFKHKKHKVPNINKSIWKGLFIVKNSISPVGSEDYWTTIEYPNGLHECWGTFGVGGFYPGSAQSSLALPFTAKDAGAITVQTSMVFRLEDNSSYFTDVTIKSRVNDANHITITSYNNGTHTVTGQIAVRVSERAIYV